LKRTIDLLTLLPKDIKDLAIQRHKQYLETQGIDINDSVASNLHNAIDHGISWSKTPEGYNFWHEIHSKIKQKEQKILSSELTYKV